MNTAGFVPLGLVLGLWLGRRRLWRWLALPAVLAVSLFLETSQMFIPNRYPSINDVIMNLLGGGLRSEEHTSELQSLMRISYAVFCLKKNNKTTIYQTRTSTIITHTITMKDTYIHIRT